MIDIITEYLFDRYIFLRNPVYFIPFGYVPGKKIRLNITVDSGTINTIRRMTGGFRCIQS